MILTDRKRKAFDVNDKQDIAQYRQFLVKSAWGPTGCPFDIEFPYTAIPDMIKDKLVKKFLKV